MSVTGLVIGFGVAVIAGLIVFALSKLQKLWNNAVCICQPENKGPCKELLDCRTIKEINADFLERRNEFWYTLCQTVVVVVILIVLAVLLLHEKISSEAAIPIISGLGSFLIGKTIAGAAKNRIEVDKDGKQQKSEG
jgi:hypothetical protein